ncbi:hypothetical protein NFI96_022516, partial [Prochilodus magdalenae]
MLYSRHILYYCEQMHRSAVLPYDRTVIKGLGFFDAHKDLINQYGRVCGYYLGRRPVVIVADPDMLRQIMVKEFHKFPNRMKFSVATKPMKESLLMLRNEQWKRVRSILTPSFSAAKMKEHSRDFYCSTDFTKQMVPLINTVTETLLTNLQAYAESGESFDIHRCFGCFTMDVIASVAFGTQVDSQNDPDDPFVHHASKFFSFTFFRPIMFVFMAFPALIRPLAALIPNKSRDEMNSFFISCIQKIIKQRDELPPNQRRRDFLQLMLDVRSSKEFVSLEQFDVVNHADEQTDARSQLTEEAANGPGHHSGESPRRPQQRREMTEDEIVGQAFLFLLAGYETSSNTLAFVSYLLAIHPDCQEKVQREVDDFYTRH